MNISFRFRLAQDYAVRNGFIGACLNFYQAPHNANLVCGTILFRDTGAEWRDIPAAELGNPPIDDIGQRFRATQDYATKNGYIGGFPNFHLADRGGLFFGTLFFNSHTAKHVDISAADLNNPPIDDIGQRFRSAYDYATENGYVGGMPNFYHADYGKGIVFGTLLFRPGTAEWRDVPAAELGNPPIDDIGQRFRTTQDFALRNGYVGGIPNFYHADYGKGIVFGTLLFRSGAAEWRDVSAAELGNPPIDDIGQRFRATQDYAVRNGFSSGTPNFYHTIRPQDLVYGTILLNTNGAEWRDIPAAELGNPPSDDIGLRFRATQDYASRNGYEGGMPNFHEAYYKIGKVFGTVLFRSGSAVWRDVPISKLGNPPLDDIGSRFRATQDYASKQVFFHTPLFVGGLPNFYIADHGGTMFGILFISHHAAAWRNVPAAELGNPPIDDIGQLFRATHDYATQNFYVGGIPTFYHADYGKGMVFGTLLFRPTAVEWRDVPAAELGNPPIDDIGQRFRATQDYALRNGYVGGIPNLYHADYGKGIVFGTLLFRPGAAELKDVSVNDLLGPNIIYGAIREKWLNLGGADGFLGLPTNSEQGTADGTGRFNNFEGGVIYWKPSTGAYEVHGSILERWSALGRERSYLGYPISDEQQWMPIPGKFPGRISNFEYGSIGWLGSESIEIPEEYNPPSQYVATPAGTSLGGKVDIMLRSNGTYTITYHMHDSGAIGYDFTVRAIFVATNGLILAGQHSGYVGGTLSSGSRDDDYVENGANALIRQNWKFVRGGRLWITKAYSATGIVGGIVGVVEDIVHGTVNVAAAITGAAAGTVIGLGHEIGKSLGGLDLGETFGIIAGVAVFASGGWEMALIATVEGVAVGALTNEMIKQRPMNSDEVKFASKVFGDKLPTDKIILTNLSGLQGRAFTFPFSGKIFVNLASDAALDDPIKFFHKGDNGLPEKDTNENPESPGQLFIHELTHAWQIAHGSFVPGTVCKGIVNQANDFVGENVYSPGPPGPLWSDFNLEQQAAIVDLWFAGSPSVVVPIRSPSDPNDPYYPYITENIRNGRT